MPNNSLPENLPESWLRQLKDTLKQDTRKTVLWTLLGSSAVAAIVSAGANVFLERMRLANAVQIENYKNCLDQRRDVVKERRSNYATMVEKFRQFSADYNDCLATSEDAVSKETGRQTPGQAYDSLQKVIDDLVKLDAAASDPILAGSPPAANVKDIDVEILKMISPTRDDKRKVARLDKLATFVEAAKLYRPKLDEPLKQIETEIKFLGSTSCP